MISKRVALQSRAQWPISRKSRRLLGHEKPFLKLLLAHSVKLVFSYVVKGRKIKITAKFRALRSLRFEDTKRTMSPEMRPKSFGTFEKRAAGLRCDIRSGFNISDNDIQLLLRNLMTENCVEKPIQFALCIILSFNKRRLSLAVFESVRRPSYCGGVSHVRRSKIVQRALHRHGHAT